LAAAVAIVLSHGVNFTDYGGFAPFGASGVLAAVPVAMFAFGGIRVLPDFAEEVRDPKHLRSTILVSVIGQSLIYILFHISYAHVSIMPRIFSTVVFPLSGHVLSSESLDRQRISTAVSLSG
jgi:amino acid transporter